MFCSQARLIIGLPKCKLTLSTHRPGSTGTPQRAEDVIQPTRLFQVRKCDPRRHPRFECAHFVGIVARFHKLELRRPRASLPFDVFAVNEHAANQQRPQHRETKLANAAISKINKQQNKTESHTAKSATARARRERSSKGPERWL